MRFDSILFYYYYITIRLLLYYIILYYIILYYIIVAAVLAVNSGSSSSKHQIKIELCLVVAVDNYEIIFIFQLKPTFVPVKLLLQKRTHWMAQSIARMSVCVSLKFTLLVCPSKYRSAIPNINVSTFLISPRYSSNSQNKFKTEHRCSKKHKLSITDY